MSVIVLVKCFILCSLMFKLLIRVSLIIVTQLSLWYICRLVSGRVLFFVRRVPKPSHAGRLDIPGTI